MADQRPVARVAVLLDCDNISATTLPDILAETAVHGLLTVKRAYGDWTSPYIKGWREQLSTHGLQPIQQFPHAVGKNSTDTALIIDAMDLLYAGNVDVFCIVSSDSDYTRLAMRLRESGKRVYGLGYQTAVEAFRMACDRFTYLEVIRTSPVPTPPNGSGQPATRPPDIVAIHSAIRTSAADDGWSSLSTVGQYLVSNDPTFDSRNHGFAKLSQLVRGLDSLEIQERTDGNGYTQIRVRLKPPPAIRKQTGQTARR